MPPKPAPVQVAWWPRDAGESSAPWVYALARALRAPRPLAYGYAQLLADYVATQWPDGVIPAGTTPEALADAAGLPVEADAYSFAQALDACGWLVLPGDGSRVVPSVAKAYAEVSASRVELAEKRAAAGRLGGLTAQAKAKQNQAKAKQTEASAEQTPSNAQAKSTIELEGELERETVETPLPPKGVPADADAGGVAPGFDELWAMAPKRGRERSGRPQALKAYRVALSKATHVAIKAGLALWLTSETWTKDGGQFVPGLHIWLQRELWAEQPTPARGAPSGPSPTTETPRPNRWAARMGGHDVQAAV